jgi:hypothetical protein
MPDTQLRNPLAILWVSMPSTSRFPANCGKALSSFNRRKLPKRAARTTQLFTKSAKAKGRTFAAVGGNYLTTNNFTYLRIFRFPKFFPNFGWEGLQKN